MAKSKEPTTRQKLDEIRHPKLLTLRGMKIGPIFPIVEDVANLPVGSRGVPRSKTKFPFSDTISNPEKAKMEPREGVIYKVFSHLPYREKRRARKRMAAASIARNRR